MADDALPGNMITQKDLDRALFDALAWLAKEPGHGRHKLGTNDPVTVYEVVS